MLQGADLTRKSGATILQGADLTQRGGGGAAAATTATAATTTAKIDPFGIISGWSGLSFVDGLLRTSRLPTSTCYFLLGRSDVISPVAVYPCVL